MATKKTTKKPGTKKPTLMSPVQAMVARQDVRRVDVVPTKQRRKDFTQALVGKKRNYKVPQTLSIPGRSAHCLAYGACNYPGELIAYEVLYAAAHLLRNAPKADAKAVIPFRRNIGSTRDNLIKHYGLTLVRAPTGQIRAAYDHDDLAKIPLEERQTRLKASIRGYIQIFRLIDPAQIKDTKLRTALLQTHGDAVKRLRAIQALRGPGTALKSRTPSVKGLRNSKGTKKTKP